MHDDPVWVVRAHAFRERHCHEWYRECADKILGAMGTGTHFPLYRMADGEFQFAIGPAANRRPLWRQGPRALLRRTLRGPPKNDHRSGATCYGYESYTEEEVAQLQSRYPAMIREIASDGILALALHDSGLVNDYLPEILDWFDDHDIPLTEANYYPMYCVYVLLHGPDRARLLGDKSILVATGLTDAKQQGIQRGLLRAGARQVAFLPLSHSHAMFDRLDLSGLRGDFDLVLVGAGVGSANVLLQLRPLRTVCLDVGFCLSTLADPTLRFQRPYCLPDDEFDPGKVSFEWRARPLRRAWLRARRVFSKSLAGGSPAL